MNLALLLAGSVMALALDGTPVIGVSDADDAIVARASAEAGGGSRIVPENDPQAATYTVVRAEPACDGNGPYSGGRACAAALNCNGSPTSVLYWQWILTYRRPAILQSVAALPTVCREAPVVSPVITDADVLSAFRRLPLKGATVKVAPSPTTLVNFDTEFDVTSSEQDFSITLLGQAVDIRAVPDTCVLAPDDPADPGATQDGPCADMTTYAYRGAGDARAVVRVTFRGQWRLAGGAWQNVPGTVTVDSAPVDLAVREAAGRLVG